MAENESAEGPRKTPEDVRIDSLEERLERAQKREAERTRTKQKGPDEHERVGSKVISLLIGGLVGGIVIGWALDRLFDTDGVLLIVGLVLGIIGGFWSIIRVAMGPSKPPTGLD